jgi:glucan phosphoethanolaminetransferase (alkaline phosphatase superfamily)
MPTMKLGNDNNYSNIFILFFLYETFLFFVLFCMLTVWTERKYHRIKVKQCEQAFFSYMMVPIFFGPQALSYLGSGDSKNKKKGFLIKPQCFTLLKRAEISNWCSLYIHVFRLQIYCIPK